MWSLVGKNNPSKTLHLKYCQTKREIYWIYRDQSKGHWKIMLEREKDETHTFRQVDMCKWQMDDPEIQMKFSLSDCTWLEDLSMEQFFKVTWKINEAKKS